MIALSSTLEAAQKAKRRLNPIVAVVLSRSGQATQTYLKDRILAITRTNSQWSHVVELTLHNADGVITALDFKGYKAIVSRGLVAAGDEYAALDPLWCLAQRYDSGQTEWAGLKPSTLHLIGTFDRINLDHADEEFRPSIDDAKTVKDLLKEVAAGAFPDWQANTVYAVGDFVKATTSNGKVFKCTAIAGDEKSGGTEPTWDTDVGDTTVDDQVTWTCRGDEMKSFAHCQAYTITFDATEETFLDTFNPADSFRVGFRETRLSVFKKLMDYVKSVARVEDDAEIHVLNPTVSGATYDYEYKLDVEAEHTYFTEGYRRRLVTPNLLTVTSYPADGTAVAGSADYSGASTASDSALLSIADFQRVVVASDAEAVDIADAKIQGLEQAADKGYLISTINVGQEIFDYIKITDSRLGLNRVGNVGQIIERYKPGEANPWQMRLSLGTTPTVITPFIPSALQPAQVTTEMYLKLIDDINERVLEIWEQFVEHDARLDAMGERVVYFQVIADDTPLTTGDGKQYFTVPPPLNGMELVDADAMVATQATAGLSTVQINNQTNSEDMLSTPITIDTDEFASYTAATPPVVDISKDKVTIADVIRIDVDGVGTGAKGLHVALTFQPP